jgi:hypothetical protein
MQSSNMLKQVVRIVTVGHGRVKGGDETIKSSHNIYTNHY